MSKVDYTRDPSVVKWQEENIARYGDPVDPGINNDPEASAIAGENYASLSPAERTAFDISRRRGIPQAARDEIIEAAAQLYDMGWMESTVATLSEGGDPFATQDRNLARHHAAIAEVRDMLCQAGVMPAEHDDPLVEALLSAGRERAVERIEDRNR